MVSVIICSKHEKLSESVRQNIDLTIGVPYEIVCINNSRREYSIFSAYNKGIAQNKYPFLCFDENFFSGLQVIRCPDYIIHYGNSRMTTEGYFSFT